MARQVLPIVGAIAGGIVGGPTGAQIGFAIGSLIGNAVDPIEMQGNKVGDAPTQVAAEGGARAIVYGKGCIRATCILERGGRRVVKQRDSGGKGSPPTTNNQRALWTYAIGLGEAIVGGTLLRVWEDEKLMYDVTPGSQIMEESARFAEKFRFYDGSEDQLPDPAIEAIYTDPDDAPYYRGTAYLVFPQRDLTDGGERVPTYRVEVATLYEATGYWDPDYTGTGGVLENDTRTFVTNTPTSLRPLSRSKIGATLEDRVYCELVIDHLPAPTGGDPILSIGVVNQAHGVNNQAYVGRSHAPSGTAKGLGVLPGRKTAQNVTQAGCGGAGSGEVFGADFVQGSVMQFALDGPGGRLYLGRDGFWDHARTNGVYGPCVPVVANPSTGIYPLYEIFNWAIGTSFHVAVAGHDGPGADHLRVTLRVNPSEFSYPIPAGFAAWGDIGVKEASQIPLSSVIAALHQRCGHTAADYDVSELTDLVAGVVIESTVTGAEAINSIIGGYFADPSDYDGQIHYIKRGAAVVRTLTADDLIDEPDEWQRNNAIEYPVKFHLFAQLADQAYAPIKATSSRYSSDIAVVGEASSQIPVTFDGSDEPYAIAVKLHKVLWTEANGEAVWPITDKYMDLVPTDCIGLSYRGQLNRVRIVQIEDTPGERKLKLLMDRQSAYTANLTAIPEPPTPTPPQPSTPSDTVLAILDTSALTDDADNLHMLVAMSGESDAWSGAQLQRSLDGGANYANALNTTFNAVMGELMLPVSSASPYYTDTTNVVRVELYTSDDLEAQTATQFLNYGGAFALSFNDSNGQQWELMQYRDATEVSPGVWELSHLMRGRKYTEGAEHPAGAVFVLLDAAVLRADAQIGWIGTDLTHRAVSNGLSPETADEQTVEYQGNSQREWPVANLILSRPTADSVLAEAVPRNRFGTNMNPVRSLNWDGYSWVATDGSNTITRDGTSEAETFDTTGWASPVTVTVAQLNRLTGAGPAVSEEIV